VLRKGAGLFLGLTLAAVTGGCGLGAASGAPAGNAIAVSKVTGYWMNSLNSRYKTYQISPQQLYNALQKNPHKYFLLDVREATTQGGVPGYDAFHIPGAVNIPFPQVGQELSKLPKHQPIVVMCYTGQWSNQTMALLRILGYQAYSMHLGMADWNHHTDVLPSRSSIPNFPVVSGSQPGTWH
jgi:rhodanese-related sulfurtransferase